MWNVIDHLAVAATALSALYYLIRTRKLERQLEVADQNLLDSTVNRMNGDR